MKPQIIDIISPVWFYDLIVKLHHKDSEILVICIINIIKLEKQIFVL